jgi:hypothetical protein
MLRMEQIITPAVDVNRQFQDAFSSDSQRLAREHDLTVFGLVQTSDEGRAKLPIRMFDALSLTTARDHTISARDLRMSDRVAGNCLKPERFDHHSLIHPLHSPCFSGAPAYWPGCGKEEGDSGMTDTSISPTCGE